MTFRERIGKLFGKQYEADANNRLLRALYSYIGMNTPLSIDDASRSYITQAYNVNSLVYSIVSWISQKAALTKFNVKDFEGNILEDHPLYNLLEIPNQLQARSEFFQQYYGFKLITGNTYIYSPRIESGRNIGQALEMFIMPAHYTEIVSDGWMNPVKEYKLNIGDQVIRFPYADVLHDKFPNFDFDYGEELYGMSPLRAAARTISKSNDAQIASQKAFQNNGAIGIISSDGDPMSEAYFTEEQAQALARGWDKKYNGADNKGKMAFISARIKYTNLGLSPVDMAIIDDLKFSLQDLCRVYHVPSQLFNDDSASTYNNMSTARKVAYTDAIIPLVQAFADEFNRWLAPSYGNVYIEPDFSQVPELQADRKELAEIYKIGVELGAYTLNEFREKLGDAMHEGHKAMDYNYMNGGRINIDDVSIEGDPLKHIDIDDYEHKQKSESGKGQD